MCRSEPVAPEENRCSFFPDAVCSPECKERALDRTIELGGLEYEWLDIEARGSFDKSLSPLQFETSFSDTLNSLRELHKRVFPSNLLNHENHIFVTWKHSETDFGNVILASRLKAEVDSGVPLSTCLNSLIVGRYQKLAEYVTQEFLPAALRAAEERSPLVLTTTPLELDDRIALLTPNDWTNNAIQLLLGHQSNLKNVTLHMGNGIKFPLGLGPLISSWHRYERARGRLGYLFENAYIADAIDHTDAIELTLNDYESQKKLGQVRALLPKALLRERSNAGLIHRHGIDKVADWRGKRITIDVCLLYRGIHSGRSTTSTLHIERIQGIRK